MNQVNYKEGAKLGRNVMPGQQIRTSKGWRKIKSVTDKGAIVTGGLVAFGDLIYGVKV